MASLYPILRRLLFTADPETAHRLAVKGLALLPMSRPAPDPEILATRAFGLSFANPIGIGAGFDKNAEAVPGLFRLGFGFVEVGTITPKPQEGNARPRVFRLAADGAVINRYGFNSDGHAVVYRRLLPCVARGLPGPLGINIGANKLSADAAGDFVQGVGRFGALADYLTVNISSPNTPGLRALQAREALDLLLTRILAARAGLERKPPLLVKIAPDLDTGARRDIAGLALRHAIDGLIVGNTTVARPESLESPHRGEAGGLSGRPLFALSTQVLADMYRLTEGHIPLIGAGGVASGADAYAKIRAGATLVQVYTALVYEGPGLVLRIKTELAALLRRDGFASPNEAVGADAR